MVHNGAINVGMENIATLIQRAQTNPQGGLSFLLGNFTTVTQGNAMLINIDGSTNVVKAMPLFTCACVIYASTDALFPPCAWVHHAPGGIVNRQDIATAINQLGNPPTNSIVVVYAHPNPNGANYTQAIANIIQAGIPQNQIAEIESLQGTAFGINANGQVGC